MGCHAEVLTAGSLALACCGVVTLCHMWVDVRPCCYADILCVVRLAWHMEKHHFVGERVMLPLPNRRFHAQLLGTFRGLTCDSHTQLLPLHSGFQHKI